MEKMKHQKPMIIVDLFIDNENKYDCLCCVPNSERNYDLNCPNVNSMAFKVNSEAELEQFLNDMNNNKGNLRVLYSIGRLEEEKEYFTYDEIINQ